MVRPRVWRRVRPEKHVPGGRRKTGTESGGACYVDPGQMDTMELWLFVASAILVAGSLAILGWSLAPQLWP